jgi:RNA polymerase sigma-70 factor (sigma-E family)
MDLGVGSGGMGSRRMLPAHAESARDGVGALRRHNSQPDGIASFRDFYASSYSSMIRLAVALLPNTQTAEDVVQDAFAGSFKRFDAIDNPEAYVRRAIVNQATGFFRRRGIAKSKESLLQADVERRAGEQNAEYDTLLSVLDALPTRQRAALVLRYYEQCTESEIAAALGCRPGTVKSLLSRGVAALRKVVDDD